MIEKSPVAYVPLGSLEWHGEHAPLGLDGLKAHALCEAAAERTGGVVFPTVYWGAFDTVPFPFTFHFKRKGIRNLARAILKQLAGWNFKAIVLLTGHYPPAQIRLLRKECRRFNKRARAARPPAERPLGRSALRRCRLPVTTVFTNMLLRTIEQAPSDALAIGIAEPALATDIEYYGDHAGMWETSLMMAIRPELVDLSAMPANLPTLERLAKFCVMGQDPISKATAEKGGRAIEHIAQRLAAVLERALDEHSDRAFEEVYKAYDKSVSIFSPGIVQVARTALDVHSLGELLRYELWTLRNLWRGT